MNPEQMRDRLRASLLALLQEHPDPQEEMNQIRRDLFRDFQATPNAQDLPTFTAEVFADGPGMRMAEQALEKEYDLAEAESPVGLVRGLRARKGVPRRPAIPAAAEGRRFCFWIPHDEAARVPG
jgi:hypothetical protein